MKALVLVLLVLAMCANSSFAQDCTIGNYADPEGTITDEIYPIDGQLFSVYVIIFAEDTVAAAAYSLNYPMESCGPYLQIRWPGPSGNGLVIDEPVGTNVALAECVIGFGGRPVLVDEYQFVAFNGWLCPVGPFTIEPNINQNPDFPIYVTCNDIIRECEIGPAVTGPVSTDARSFSAVKSLYH